MSYDLQIMGGVDGWQTVIHLNPDSDTSESMLNGYLVANTVAVQFHNRHVPASWRIIDNDTDEEKILVAKGGFDIDPSHLHNSINLFIHSANIPMNTIVLAPEFYD